MSFPVVVLAGGRATRMRPLTDQVPKILIDVAGRPFAEQQLTRFRAEGITHVVYSLGYLGEQVAAALGDGSRFGMRFTYVFDGPRLLGTGGALRAVLQNVPGPLFVTYGDSYLQCSFADVERAFVDSGKLGLMTVFRNGNRWGRSNVTYANGQILKYDKQSVDEEMQHIDYGLGILTSAALDPWRDVSEAFDLADVYRSLLTSGQLAGYEVSDRFYEIGSAEGLEETRALLGRRQQATT